jgi:CubicO group peptidase (beta-lactamase class C family)
MDKRMVVPRIGSIVIPLLRGTAKRLFSNVPPGCARGDDCSLIFSACGKTHRSLVHCVIAGAFGLLVGVFGIAHRVTADEQAIPRIDALFEAEAAAHSIGGITVGIVSGPNLIWTKSYGLADMEAGTPATRHTVYRIGSITKQFTALMLLKLADDGRLKLSDAVATYVPDVARIRNQPEGSAPITLLQLATHRAGLDREPEGRAFWSGPVSAWEETTRAALPHVSYRFEPGAKFFYSNIGYAILGLAIQSAAGEPYTDYVSERILRPLGMTSTDFEPTPAMRSTLAKGYQVRSGRGDSAMAAAELATGRGYKVPNGALFTTVDDLAKFVSFEMGAGPAGVLNATTLHVNLDQAFPETDPNAAYGVGFERVSDGSRVVVGHTGSVAGYEAAAYFYPNSQKGLILLRNAEYDQLTFRVFFRALAMLAD